MAELEKKMEKEVQKKKTSRGVSLFHRMMIPVIIILAVQLLGCFLVLGLSGNIDKLKREKYSQFHKVVAKRAERVGDILVDKRNCARVYKERLEGGIAAYLAGVQHTTEDLNKDAELNEDVIAQMADEIEELLKNSGGSGAFLILGGYGEDSQTRCGYYLRNTNAKSTDERYFTVLRGSEHTLKQVEFSASKDWRPTFRIESNDAGGYYNKIASKMQEETDYGSFAIGYWSPVFTIYGDDVEMITYTMPLVDQNNNFYGVLGVEVSVEMLLDELPYHELSSDSSSGYYLAYKEENGDSYSTMVVSAASGKDITDKNGHLMYEQRKSFDYIYDMAGKSQEDRIGSLVNMEIYATQSPFIAESWALVGVLDEKQLMSVYNNFLIYLWITFAFVILVGIVGMWYMAYRFSGYVRKITYAIHSSSPEQPLYIETDNVTDIRELADMIQELYDRGTSAEKLVMIIDMAGVQVGAIEYCEEDNYVFCTQKAAEILEFHQIGKGSYISRKAFGIEIEVLKKNFVPYDGEENTYRMISKTGTDKWIRIQSRERENRHLVAVLDVTAEILEKQKIEYERDYDILTRLLNRNAFRARMGQMLKRGNLGVAAVVMMDLDNLKYFNDTYGHEYGDRYIREAAVVLSTMNQYNALVARMSGDEFLMFISGYSSKDEIRELVYEVHRRLLESYITVPGGEHIRLRASAGIAWYPDDAAYLDELIKYADFAMYEIKSTKKGDIKEFNRERYQKNSLLFTGKEELNRLIEVEGMVRYIFQPIVEVRSGEIFGYEALMRPQIDSLRSPEDVMRLAKAQSKLYQVEKVTWNVALSELMQQWKPGDDYRIFINSVPNHVLEERDTQELENKYEHLLKRVIIEIIESEQTDKSCMETKCEWAKKHGASIALDDFGTGYSNESTLLYINPDYVKLDMSIITNIHKDEGRQKIVEGLLAYTKSHGIKVIAEGIDCYEEMQTLIRLGVDYMQGWYLARGQYAITDIPEELKAQIRECVKKVQEEME